MMLIGGKTLLNTDPLNLLSPTVPTYILSSLCTELLPHSFPLFSLPLFSLPPSLIRPSGSHILLSQWCVPHPLLPPPHSLPESHLPPTIVHGEIEQRSFPAEKRSQHKTVFVLMADSLGRMASEHSCDICI
eukprot:85709-Rhodomonas_salina.1